ncbi:MAG: hypothetical protein ACOY32_02670 [Thermodesulfobacteriota bacterium]
MAKIIRLEQTRKKPGNKSAGSIVSCEHRHVIAYTWYRTVCCARCGATLDPFDVLVDMLKASPPEEENGREEKKFRQEAERRSGAKIGSETFTEEKE